MSGADQRWERSVPVAAAVIHGSVVSLGGRTAEVTRLIGHLTQIAGTGRHSRLIAACLERMEPFRLSRQTPVIDSCLDPTNTHREGARG
ncbi:hypothetical protein GCM10009602_66730 [Nocardiopsis tropica]